MEKMEDETIVLIFFMGSNARRTHQNDATPSCQTLTLPRSD